MLIFGLGRTCLQFLRLSRIFGVKAKFQLEMRMEIKKVLKLISHAQMKMRANTYLAAQNLYTHPV